MSFIKSILMVSIGVTVTVLGYRESHLIVNDNGCYFSYSHLDQNVMMSWNTCRCWFQGDVEKEKYLCCMRGENGKPNDIFHSDTCPSRNRRAPYSLGMMFYFQNFTT